MFEEYLSDARYFVAEGRRATKSGDADSARRSYRAAVIVGNAAMETFVNFLASTFEAAPQSLQPYELALLLEKRFGHVDGEFKMQEQQAFSRLEDRIRFLGAKFSIPLDYAAVDWSQFIAFKRLRDSLVHSKDAADVRSVEEYDQACAQGIGASVRLMDVLSQGIFKKPLRSKLHDLADFSSL